MKCAEWVKCKKCGASGIEAIHWPRYVTLICNACGHRWSER